MLFTGKGDDGTTSTFGCDQRISKSSLVAEALGALDECNSFLGLCKVSAQESGITMDGSRLADIVHAVQEDLFIVQAELAGAGKTITEEKVRAIEGLVNLIEKELPPIKTFFISGGCELSSRLDVARTLARRGERRVIAVGEEGKQKIGKQTLAYLNRLSSLLYALARLSNHKSGIVEESPRYE